MSGWKVRRFREPVNLSDAVAIQQEVARQVRIRPMSSRPEWIAGMDCAFVKNNEVVGAVVLWSHTRLEIVDVATAVQPVSFPYIPGFLAFREMGVLLEALQRLPRTPDLLLVDGQGIAHPRGAGIAVHLAVETGIPSIGCAKSRLYGEPRNAETFLPGHRGAWHWLYDPKNPGKRVGMIVRTRTGVRPLYVSPGSDVSWEDCLCVVLQTACKFRLPEPLRLAHHFATRKKQEVLSTLSHS